MFREEDLDSVLEIAVKYATFDSATRESDVRKAAHFPRGFWVAEVHGKVVGFIWGHLKDMPAEVLERWNAAGVGYVDLMAVLPAYRRRGAGEALLLKLLEEFKRAHTDVVLLDCPAEARDAARLYAKLGFDVRFQGMSRRL